MNGRIRVAILAALALSAITLVTPSAQQSGPGSQFVPGELLVRFSPAYSGFQRDRALAAQGARLMRRFAMLDVDHVRLAPGQTVAAGLAVFKRLPSVALVQPNYIRRPVGSAPPDDPYWLAGYLWGLERIQAHPAWWSFTMGAPDVVIADLDTGVDYTHPDLAANMWRNPGEVARNRQDDDGNGYVDDVHGIDTFNHDSDPMDDHGHGTHTAGTIAATGNNGTGVVGVAWGSRILACKFINSAGSGTDAGAIECFNYIVALKQRGIAIRVSSNSWGSARGAEPAVVLQAAIDEAGNAGILNVFAAGNAGTDNDLTPFDPASLSSASVLAVAASNQADGRPSFSNYGAASVDLAAPGDFILSTYGGNYTFASGTSMAAPHVSGAAALMVSKEPTLTVDAMKALLMQAVDPLPQWSGLVASGGRLNVLTAITAAGGNIAPTVTMTSPAPGASFPVSTLVQLEATASDLDGTVNQVQFYANGVAVGTDTTGAGGVYSVGWTGMVAGTYQLTAVATDDAGATRTSSPVTIGLAPPPGRVNVALAANGSVALASSSYGSGYPADSLINGDRKGLQWGSGGGWADGTADVWPDWVEVRFNGPQSIEEIDIFTVQDSHAAPAEPTPTMTFTRWGVRAFNVEYWTGTAWQAVPGGTVIGNNNVWRVFNFAPVTTSSIRILITDALQSNSRLVEIEAYAVLGTENHSPTVTLTSPTNGETFAAGAAIPLEAAATDSDGSVSRVDFHANGQVVGTDTVASSGVFSLTWEPAVGGTYSLTAVATDDRGAIATSSAITISVTPPAGRANVALTANGGVAIASSAYSSAYPVSSLTNGDRKGLGWGSGGGWADGTSNMWPDWVEVQFNGTQLIEEIDVFTVQDNYAAPSDPTPSMTFTQWGVRAFVVEYWTGTGWQPVPGGVVSNNSHVWRQVSFVAVATSRIRVSISEGLASNSRLTEIEAYAVLGSQNLAPSVTITSPSSGASFPVSNPVVLDATATDDDGTVSQVEFYANAVLVGTDSTDVGGSYSVTWTPTLAGTYTLTAVAVDDRGAMRTSSPVAIAVTPPPGRVNVALPANGGLAVASSTYSSLYPVSSLINGDRKGVGWGSGGGWADGTAKVWPDWVEVEFNGARTIEEIDVFTVQDNYAAPSDPTLSMTFTKWGVRDFVVEYWTGSAWQTLPGGSVSNNASVWRQFNFAPVTTSRIRVFITKGLASNSRLTEIEVYASIGG
jgi:subtilisin family serine protease